jgi:hypothetical protein
LVLAQCARERRVAAQIAQGDDFVEQFGSLHMRGLGQALAAVRQEPLKLIRYGPSDAGDAFPSQVVPYGLAIAGQVPGDRRDRPSLAAQRTRLRVFLLG